MNTSSWTPPRSTTIFSCKNVCPTTFKSLLPAVTPNFHSISTSWLTMNVWPTTDLERAIRFDFHLSETWGELSAERPFKDKNEKTLGWLECSFIAARFCSHVQLLEPDHGLKKFNQSRSYLPLYLLYFPGKAFLQCQKFMANSWNRLFPNWPKPRFQSEAKCETIDLKMTFIHTQIKLIFTRNVWHLASQPPFSGSTRGTRYEIRGGGGVGEGRLFSPYQDVPRPLSLVQGSSCISAHSWRSWVNFWQHF